MTTWRDFTTVHPLANSFPEMSGDELRELAEDIEKHSQREPVIFAEIDGVRTLVDGRHRLDACAMIGREPWTTTVDFKDDAEVQAFIISQNVHRRHLTPAQRQARLEAAIVANPEKSDRAIAKETGVSQPTVGKTRKKMAATDKGLSVGKRTGLDGRTRKLRAKKVAKDEAQDVCNALAADLGAAINDFAVGTPEVSADERKAQYAGMEVTDTDAAAPPVEQLADTPIEPPDSKDSEIAALKARIVELESTGPRVVLDPTNHQCSFCTKSSGEVSVLIKGSGEACICDECVADAVKILEERSATKPPVKRARGRPPGSKNKPKTLTD